MTLKGKNITPAGPDIRTAEGFEIMYNLYWHKVYSICEAGTGNSEEAKELTQTIFISLWQRRNDIHIESPVEHYLFKAARYQVINYYRQRKTISSYHNYLYTEHCVNDNFTENKVLYRELDERVNELVARLSTQCRQVFQLREEQGLSLKAIADIQNISVKTVQYHLDNARKYLKKELTEFL